MYTDSMLQSYEWFFVNPYWIILTICSLGIILWYYRKNKRICKLVVTGIICFLAGVNSISKNLVTKVYSSGASTFYRLFWVLPVVLLCVFAGILLIKSMNNKIIKICIFTLFFVGLLIISPLDEFVQNGKLPENVYFVSDEIVELNDLMKDNFLKKDRYYISDSFVYLGLESYSNHLLFPFFRDIFPYYDEWISRGNEKYDLMFKSVWNGEKADKEGRKQIKEVLSEIDITYIVINKGVFLPKYYEKLGYHYLGETDNYIVYERDLQMKN